MDFEPGPEHALLSRMHGAWEGPTMTWLEPGQAVPDTSTWRGRVEPVLGGRFVRFVYGGGVGGKLHNGELLLGFDRGAGRWVAAWVDSFHTGTSILHFAGPGGGDVDVTGSYGAGEQTWGWRIRVTRGSPEELAVEHWNVRPDGEGDRAITTRLTRPRPPAGD